MRKNLTTVDEVVDSLGGTGAVADLVGVWPSAVSNWRARGFIAPDKFRVISEALEAAGARADLRVFGFRTAAEART